MYLRRAINNLKNAQRDLTNAQVLSKEIDHDDNDDVDSMLDCIISRLERHDRRNTSKKLSEDLSDSLTENLK